MIVKILLIVGGINWGLVGVGMLLDKGAEAWNVVQMLLRPLSSTGHLEGLVYLLVGIAAVVSIFGCKCRKCKEGVCASCGPDEKVPGSM